MQTVVVTLSDFILDRLADLELAAQVALATAPPEPIEGITPAGAVWFSPERVLADVAAKRAIVEAHPPGFEGNFGFSSSHGLHPDWIECPDCEFYTIPPYECGPCRGPCATLRALASAYADHPDYDEAWRP